jgi:hypothetical protein
VRFSRSSPPSPLLANKSFWFLTLAVCDSSLALARRLWVRRQCTARVLSQA